MGGTGEKKDLERHTVPGPFPAVYSRCTTRKHEHIFLIRTSKIFALHLSCPLSAFMDLFYSQYQHISTRHNAVFIKKETPICAAAQMGAVYSVNALGPRPFAVLFPEQAHDGIAGRDGVHGDADCALGRVIRVDMGPGICVPGGMGGRRDGQHEGKQQRDGCDASGYASGNLHNDPPLCHAKLVV